jgi:large conductance mechanosensitive channel
MSIAKEFREFAVKGNVVDMAVGIIIGAAFGKIVSSLVSDVVLPPIGLLIGGVKFTSLSLTLREAVPAVGDDAAREAVTLNYGMFVQSAFDFVIIAFVIFMVVKGINRLKRQVAAAPTPPAVPLPPPRQEVLLEEIRDLLKK